MLRRDTMLSVGGYREVPDAEDYDLWLRIADRFSLGNLGVVLLRYRIHPAQSSVARTVRQAYGALASQASARLRLEGKLDLLEGSPEVDAALLKRMGVSDVVLQTMIARGYLACARNLSRAQNFSLALAMLITLGLDTLSSAESWVIADGHLCRTRIYWLTGRYLDSLRSLFTACSTRPIILARPVKSLWCNLTDCLSRYGLRVFQQG